jgi:hypothetical protein
MSLLGHSRRSDPVTAISDLPRQPDILATRRHVSKVPHPDSCIAARLGFSITLSGYKGGTSG